MQRLKQLEKKMHQHARDLEFEEAARLRGQIHALRQAGLELPESMAS
jgi:excinuclease ABC subunit B